MMSCLLSCNEINADFLELTLQFGMVTMFASAFPLVFVFGLIVRKPTRFS